MMPRTKSEIRSYLITSDFIYNQHSAQEYSVLLQEFKKYWHETNAQREGVKNELDRSYNRIKYLEEELEKTKNKASYFEVKTQEQTNKIEKVKSGFFGWFINKIYKLN